MKRIALVTGGTRGIGLGIASALAAEKWDLIVNGVRPEEAAAEALAGLRAGGSAVSYAQGDISTAEGRASILSSVEKHAGGRLNLLVNNAGIAPKVRADVLETSEESFDQVLDTNLRGVFFLTQTLARSLCAARKSDPTFQAAIVNITSISASVVSVNRAEYCIAKAGLSMLTQLFAARLGAEGIPVYEVRPGVIKTDMTAGVSQKYDALIANGLCVQPRWGFPSDIGMAVASLARGDFPYSTGQVIHIDGGLCMPRL